MDESVNTFAELDILVASAWPLPRLGTDVVNGDDAPGAVVIGFVLMLAKAVSRSKLTHVPTVLTSSCGYGFLNTIKK